MHKAAVAAFLHGGWHLQHARGPRVSYRQCRVRRAWHGARAARTMKATPRQLKEIADVGPTLDVDCLAGLSGRRRDGDAGIRLRGPAGAALARRPGLVAAGNLHAGFLRLLGRDHAVQPHDHHAGTLHARSQRRRGLRAGPKSGHAGPGARLNLRALQWQ